MRIGIAGAGLQGAVLAEALTEQLPGASVTEYTLKNYPTPEIDTFMYHNTRAGKTPSGDFRGIGRSTKDGVPFQDRQGQWYVRNNGTIRKTNKPTEG